MIVCNKTYASVLDSRGLTQINSDEQSVARFDIDLLTVPLKAQLKSLYIKIHCTLFRQKGCP